MTAKNLFGLGFSILSSNEYKNAYRNYRVNFKNFHGLLDII